MNPRIYSEHEIAVGGPVELTGNAARHISRVLRLREGDDIVVFDGSGKEFSARIDKIGKQSVTLTAGDGRHPATESSLRITLLQGICRGQRMDYLVQKSTELGIACIRPIACERSVVRLDEKRGSKKLGHWRQIAISACEQSGRVKVPRIEQLASLAEAIECLSHDFRLVLDPRADRSVGDALAERPAGASGIALLIGPEGGLSEAERSLANSAGFVDIRLGPRVLRTETAPLAALTVLQYLAGDLG